MYQIIYCLFLLIVLSTNTYAQQDGCSTFNQQLKPGQKLFEGFGKEKSDARESAIIALQQTVSDTVVQTQYISRSNNTEHKFQYNQHIKSKGAVNGIENIKIVACKKDYKAYLIYNERSLETQIAHYFNNKKVRLKGADYLVKSELLSPYHQASSKGELIVNIFKGKNNEFFLFLGDHKLKLSQNELKQLINLDHPNLKNNNFNISVKKQNDHLGVNAVLTIDNDGENYQQRSHVFVCRFTGECQLLYTDLIIEQPMELLVNIDKITLKNDFIFLAFQQELLSLHDLYSRYESDNLFIPLLNISNNHPEKSCIKTAHFRSF